MSYKNAAKKFAPGAPNRGQIGRGLPLRGGGGWRGAGVGPFGVTPAAFGGCVAGSLTPYSYLRFTHTLRGSRLLQLPNRNRGRDNGNPLNMFEGKHMALILGNNHIDLTGNSGSQDRVVLWVR